MNPKFETLVNIIDRIRGQAPTDLQALYSPPSSDQEKTNQARARSFIHLYLMVKHGILDFQGREEFVCDDQHDGGLDAYYIDHEKKIVYLIQSKFHQTGAKFENSVVSIDELAKMELDRILRGEKKTSYGKPYNAKIRKFQQLLTKLTGKYERLVILLGNLRTSRYKIGKAIGYNSFDVFDFDKTYRELLLPYCTATYYVPEKIDMAILLPNKQEPALLQYAKTLSGETEVMVIYAPSLEIGRLMSTYKNSILQDNPRNYLSLKSNKVNRDIRNSITTTKTNDFAILNNGITILVDNAHFDPSTGSKKWGRLTLTNPQIINGGQTAYTLSDIYEKDLKDNPHIFDGKEVMLKIVRLKRGHPNRDEFVRTLSNTANTQSSVGDADRKSNNRFLIQVQSEIFDTFGYFLERKRGEFYHASIMDDVLDTNYIISRLEFVRAYTAFVGLPSFCKSRFEGLLFSEQHLEYLFSKGGVFKDAFVAYKIYQRIKELEKSERKNDYGRSKYGFALRYGQYAIVAAASVSKEWNLSGKENLDELAKFQVADVLSKWKKFERQAKKKAAVASPFHGKAEGLINYYKSTTMDADVKDYFARP